MTKSFRLQALIEIISAAAVVGTLIFLAIEIRQNTEQTALNARAVEIAAYQDLISQITKMNELEILDAQFQFSHKNELSREELEEYQADVQLNFDWIRFRHGDMAYFQYENGIIDKDRLDSALRKLGLSNPLQREAWQRIRQAFTEGYRNYIDQIVAEGERKDAEEQNAAEK
jgi:hypothetical protein